MELLYKIKNLQHIRWAAIFVVLNIFDALLTWTMVQQGGYELNPVTRLVLQQNSALAYYAFKMGRTFILVAVLLYLSNIFPRLLGKVFIVVTIAVAGVCIFNLLGYLQWI